MDELASLSRALGIATPSWVEQANALAWAGTIVMDTLGGCRVRGATNVMGCPNCPVDTLRDNCRGQFRGHSLRLLQFISNLVRTLSSSVLHDRDIDRDINRETDRQFPDRFRDVVAFDTWLAEKRGTAWKKATREQTGTALRRLLIDPLKGLTGFSVLLKGVTQKDADADWTALADDSGLT